MGLTDQIDMLHTWLAAHPRPAAVTVSDHLQHCASAGDLEARCVLASGLFNGADGSVEAPQAAAPVPPHVQNREHRLATQQLPTTRKLNTREPSRPIVHSGAVRDWMTK